MAIRRSTFQACQVTRYWQGALSDDYTLGRAVKERHLVIRFQPRCLSFSYETYGWKEVFNFISRQISITRVYSPGLWTGGLVAQALHCLSFWGGAVLLITAVSLGAGSPRQQITLSLLWATIYGLGCVKSALRLRAVAELMPKQRSLVYRHWSLHLFSGPLVTALTLWGIVGSLWKREIEWRGIRYRMISSRETMVLGNIPDR